MVVAIHPANGWYYRINTKPWRPAVRLIKDPFHPFLDYDSYLECGDPLELDDYMIDEALRRHGIIGVISKTVCGEIKKYLASATTLSERDVAEICAILDSC
jgi:hypothetical protein